MVPSTLGAAAIAGSAFVPWVTPVVGDDLHARDIEAAWVINVSPVRVAESMTTSLYFFLLAAALIALLGVLMRWRPVVFVSGICAVVFPLMWLMQENRSPLGLDPAGDTLGPGMALAVLGGVVAMVGAAVLRPREIDLRTGTQVRTHAVR